MRAYISANVKSMGSSLWSAYVRSVAPRERQEDIAEKTGVSQSTISRWASGTVVPSEPAKVAAFARACGRNVLEAFVAADMLDEADAGRGLSAKSRRYLADLREQAATELAARAAIRGALDRHQGGLSTERLPDVDEL